MAIQINFLPENEMLDDYYSTGMGWYLHGELETDAEFDICGCSVNPRTVEEGIHKVTYKNTVEASLYCWKIETEGYIQHRGIIVKDSDTESVIFAKSKFEKRSRFP
jgi:hypothetical protein